MSYDLRIRSECLGFRGHHRPASAASTTCMAALLRRLFCSLELGFRLRGFLPISYRRCTLQTTHICPRRIKFGSVKYSQCIPLSTWPSCQRRSCDFVRDLVGIVAGTAVGADTP